MNVISFEQKPCQRVRGYLDSYVNNELLIETNHEVLKHLEICSDCSNAFEERVRLRSLLQRAVKRESAPADLQEKIQRRIRGGRFLLDLRSHSSSWALAAAASLLLGLVGWGSYRVWNLSNGPSISEITNAILNIGVADHVTCAIDHKVSNRHYTFEQMTQEMGPDFSGLVPLVSERVPDNYEVVVAHQCKANQRNFVHVIMRKDNSVVSLVITKKTGSFFPQSDLAEVIQASGVSLHQARLQNYEVTGFETKGHLAFVVSDLVRDKNLQIAMTLAPSVRGYLAKLEI